MSLDIYKKKRDFDKTPEPQAFSKNSEKNNFPIFVIQKHNASRLHYDLRLEAGGVLKSWAVPKGPTLNPEQRHLAMHVEDHPYEYAFFEGVIPRGNYGAGEVIVWDMGKLITPSGDEKEMVTQDINKGIKEGHITFFLNGKKLKGEFALVKIKNSNEENAWLLIKAKDSYVRKDDITKEAMSVLSSASLEGLKKKPYIVLSNDTRPQHIKPMLAKSTKSPFDDKNWLFEIKWDGYRMIADVRNHKVKLYSRNLIHFTEKFKPIKEVFEQINDDFILDGEVVAYDEKSRVSFNLLENYQSGQSTIIYYIFDLIYLRGKDLRSTPLLERKEKLKEILTPISTSIIRYNDHIFEKGQDFFALLKQQHLEGMIAKKIDSAYSSGIRSSCWLKIRNLHEIKATICGFTQTESRSKISALILGVNKGKHLQYIGKVGTGFNEKEINKLQAKFLPITIPNSPFSSAFQSKERIIWLNPIFDCLVHYTEWTLEGYLRHPVYHGLINDPAFKKKG